MTDLEKLKVLINRIVEQGSMVRENPYMLTTDGIDSIGLTKWEDGIGINDFYRFYNVGDRDCFKCLVDDLNDRGNPFKELFEGLND